MRGSGQGKKLPGRGACSPRVDWQQLGRRRGLGEGGTPWGRGAGRGGGPRGVPAPVALGEGNGQLGDVHGVAAERAVVLARRGVARRLGLHGRPKRRCKNRGAVALEVAEGGVGSTGLKTMTNGGRKALGRSAWAPVSRSA